jgi:LPXTG-site transpeptidase (sortase) family protein
MQYVTLTILVAALVGSTAFVAKQGLPVDTSVLSSKDEALASEEVVESVFGVMDEEYFTPKQLFLNDEIVLSIESIGLDSIGQLQTPKNWQGAGWYFRSAKPGDRGTVIIDGHYDMVGGAPAAFFSLKNTKVNDTVVLVDDLDRSFTYKVTSTSYVDINDPNRTDVFEKGTGKRLVLVTCGGVWNASLQTYDKRLVVEATLLEQ